MALGRTYLAQSPGLIQALCNQLNTASGEREGGMVGWKESNAMKNALGAVQKLSLRLVV